MYGASVRTRERVGYVRVKWRQSRKGGKEEGGRSDSMSSSRVALLLSFCSANIDRNNVGHSGKGTQSASLAPTYSPARSPYAGISLPPPCFDPQSHRRSGCSSPSREPPYTDTLKWRRSSLARLPSRGRLASPSRLRRSRSTRPRRTRSGSRSSTTLSATR